MRARTLAPCSRCDTRARSPIFDDVAPGLNTPTKSVEAASTHSLFTDVAARIRGDTLSRFGRFLQWAGSGR